MKKRCLVALAGTLVLLLFASCTNFTQKSRSTPIEHNGTISEAAPAVKINDIFYSPKIRYGIEYDISDFFDRIKLVGKITFYGSRIDYNSPDFSTNHRDFLHFDVFEYDSENKKKMFIIDNGNVYELVGK